MNYNTRETGTIEFEVGSLYERLKRLSDRRKARGKRYELALILTLSVLAKLSGEDSVVGIAEWVKWREETLRSALQLQHAGLPHAATYRRVLGSAVDVEELEKEVGLFLGACVKPDEAVAIDGKSIRGSIATGQTRGVYLLAVYAPMSGVVLRQVEIGHKENELSATPDLLASVNLAGRVVTGDALFTQRSLSEQIVSARGDYLWRVKDNQPTLRADIARLFGPERVPAGAGPLKTDFQTSVTHHKVSGRCETHTLTTSSLLNATTNWPSLAQVFRLERTVTYPASGKTTHETVYGLTSLPASSASPARLLSLVRNHWTIENRLHYCRDVVFHEDASLTRFAHLPHVLAILNNLVLSLLRLHQFDSPTAARRQLDASPLLALSLILSPLP